MSKLRLELDQLSVETFSIQAEMVQGDGTVQGHQLGGQQVGDDSGKYCTVVTCKSCDYETCALSCGCMSGQHTCQATCGLCILPGGPELETDLGYVKK